MIRSFEVRAINKLQVCNLSRRLDDKLHMLQENGWEVISIFHTPCEEYESGEGYFNSTLFTIIAKFNERGN